MLHRPIYRVSDISDAIKETLEQRFRDVAVRGEVSKVFKSLQGHLYFSLKDDKALLHVVCWRSTAQSLSMEWEDGLEVICYGRVTSYGVRSTYQLIAHDVRPSGHGALYQMLASRRLRLEKEGLFAESRKRPLPFLPKIIGVVSSPQGAVIHDVMHRLNERFPRPVVLWPCAVQGERAPQEICAALRGFAMADGKSVPRVDVIIVARGGGSIEELWSFNEEEVVRAIAASPIPVISAIGHETDTTLADFVADYRAPTPTAAAERCVPVRHQLHKQCLDTTHQLVLSMARLYDHGCERHRALTARLPMPQRFFDARGEMVRLHEGRLRQAVTHTFSRQQQTMCHAQRLLESCSPYATMKRGYAIVRQDGVVKNRKDALCEETNELEISFYDGKVDAVLT